MKEQGNGGRETGEVRPLSLDVSNQLGLLKEWADEAAAYSWAVRDLTLSREDIEGDLSGGLLHGVLFLESEAGKCVDMIYEHEEPNTWFAFAERINDARGGLSDLMSVFVNNCRKLELAMKAVRIYGALAREMAQAAQEALDLNEEPNLHPSFPALGPEIQAETIGQA